MFLISRFKSKLTICWTCNTIQRRLNNQHNSFKLFLAYFLTLFERTTFGPWWWFLAIWDKMKEAKIFNFILKSGSIFYISFSLLKTQYLLFVTYQSLSLPTSYIWNWWTKQFHHLTKLCFNVSASRTISSSVLWKPSRRAAPDRLSIGATLSCH